MAEYFDEKKWYEAIQHPNWYLTLSGEFKQLIQKAAQSSPEQAKEIKEACYGFFETHLNAGTIALGKSGPHWDEERKPIDTIVIHHTKNPPGISWQRLSAMHLIRLYASYYASPQENEQHIAGTPLYSHHFRDNHMVFYAYHWLIRMDGAVERLLEDTHIGWHAGNWDINCRSVALCLDNNFETKTPPQPVLEAVATLIRTQYPHVRPERVLGHREINSKTTCPGNTFLNEWKAQIVELL